MKAKSFDLIRYDADDGKVLIGKNQDTLMKRAKSKNIFMLKPYSLAQMIVLITTLKQMNQQQRKPPTTNPFAIGLR